MQILPLFHGGNRGSNPLGDAFMRINLDPEDNIRARIRHTCCWTWVDGGTRKHLQLGEESSQHLGHAASRFGERVMPASAMPTPILSFTRHTPCADLPPLPRDPVVGAYPNPGRWQSVEELRDLAAPKLTPDHRLFVLIDAVYLLLP